jgi:hypothetical protein
MIARASNGSISGTSETATNKIMVYTQNFTNISNTFAQFTIQMPKSWDSGNVFAQFIWSHDTATGNLNVNWGIQATAIGDGIAIDTPFNAPVSIVDTGGSINTLYITSDTAVFTANNADSSKWICFQIYRNTTTANNLAANAKLIGVRLKYTTNSETDA